MWTEGPVNKSITSGHFSHQLGSDTPLDAAALGQLGGLYLGVAVGGDPELPRQALGSSLYAVVAGTASTLTCSGCVGANQLAAGAVTADAIDFNYAASDIKGGAATDLACTGCVSVDEMNFDGNVDLGNNALKAAAVNTGSLVATSITATEFVGDGSKLTGIQLPQGTCPSGQVVTGIQADGSLACGDVASSLPKDALDDVSNGVISNEFTDTFTSPDLPLDIKDNFPVGVSLEIDVPDVGLAKSLTVTVDLTASTDTLPALTCSGDGGADAMVRFEVANPGTLSIGATHTGGDVQYRLVADDGACTETVSCTDFGEGVVTGTLSAAVTPGVYHLAMEAFEAGLETTVTLDIVAP